MLKGAVKFRSRIVDVDKGVTFPVVEFNVNEPCVGKVEIEGPTGREVRTTVYLTKVTNEPDGISIATKLHRAVLDRISFTYEVALENGRIIESGFEPVDPPPPGDYRITPATGHHVIDGQDVRFERGLSKDRLKNELESQAPAGENNFSLFRSALQSTSQVEKFMHLYNILLMIFRDDQRRVDDFIRNEKPSVPQTPRPDKPRVFETVYSRLRNELGHHRKGVDLAQTKKEMTARLGELIALTKRAIELYS
jgi:hypothetical protein